MAPRVISTLQHQYEREQHGVQLAYEYGHERPPAEDVQHPPLRGRWVWEAQALGRLHSSDRKATDFTRLDTHEETPHASDAFRTSWEHSVKSVPATSAVC